MRIAVASALALPLVLAAAPPLAAQPDMKLWETIRRLDDKSPERRERAALELAALGPRARPAVPYLIEALGDEHVPVYVAASFALERIGEPALPELAAALRDSGTVTRVEVSRILGRLGARALDGVGGLLEALKSGDPLAREAASAALGEIFDAAGGVAGHPLASETVAGLIRSLEHSSPDPAETYARSAAAAALGKLGTAAAPAVPVLVGHLADRDPRVRTACAWALGGGFLEPTQTRWMAPRRTRGGIGAPAEVAVPALIAALGDPDAAVRWSAAQSLAGLGAAARPAIPHLWQLIGTGPVAAEAARTRTPEPTVDADGVVMVPLGSVIRVTAGDAETARPAAAGPAPVPGAIRVPAGSEPSGSSALRVPANTGSGAIRVPADGASAGSGAILVPANAGGGGSGSIRVPASGGAGAGTAGPAARPDLALHASVLRLHAAATLCELGETDAARRIAEILRDDENAAARELAVVLLGRLRPPAAARALSEALADSDWQVREAAAGALSRIQP